MYVAAVLLPPLMVTGFAIARMVPLGAAVCIISLLPAGLLLRNPIIPAIVMLFWEGINPLLPAMLQKLSVLYYVQALTPVGAPTDPGAPLLIQLLMSPAEPPSTAGAVLGLVALTAVVLWVASHAVRRLEINYSTD